MITGRGLISAVGSRLVELRNDIGLGCTSKRPITPLRAHGREGQTDYLEVEEDGWLRPRSLLSSDRFTTLSAAATAAALEEAEIHKDESRLALVMGTTCGPGMATEAFITRLAERGVSGLSPSLFLDSIISMPAGFISICLGIDGSIAVVNGTHPLDVARWWLATGREDTVILLATETYSPVFLRAISGFRKTDYHGYQQPTLAQASAALVIETRARVEERGAHCVARLVGMASGPAVSRDFAGWSMSQHLIRPIIASALDSCGVAPHELDIVCSCANGLSLFDQEERYAWPEMSKYVRVVRYKELFGETLGANSIVSLISATLAIEQALTLSPDARLRALVNNYEVGGQFSAVVLAAP